MVCPCCGHEDEAWEGNEVAPDAPLAHEHPKPADHPAEVLRRYVLERIREDFAYSAWLANELLGATEDRSGQDAGGYYTNVPQIQGRTSTVALRTERANHP